MKTQVRRYRHELCPAILGSVVTVWLSVQPALFAQRPAQGPMSAARETPEAMGYELVWQDDFNGKALDAKKWEVRGVGPRALGYVSPEAVRVDNGYLKLQALKKEGRILLGAVGTQNHFMARYGFFECRAQLQKSPGVWAAFWIQSPEISKGEDPAVYGAEIDIMECFKKLGPDIVSHNVHWAYGPHQQTTHGMQSYLKGVSAGFHLFALEWTPEKYAFFVDGYRFYEVRTGISKIEEYLILSMEIPSKWEEIKDARLPDEFVVDYVKVYQKKPISPNATAAEDDSKPEAGFVSLYNGKDLTGWSYRDREEKVMEAFDGKTEATDKRYTAKPGVLVVNPQPEGAARLRQLWTTREFPKDFHLKLEFRAAVNADSGIFLRKPQLQCRDYLVAGPYKTLLKYRPQDWNEIEVVVKDGVARCTCNGEVLEAALKLPDTGPIGLEADRGQMEYRRIRIKELR